MSTFVASTTRGGTCRVNTSVVHRSNVVGSIYRSGSPRGLDHGRGVRRLIGNVDSFYTRQRRRKGLGILLNSFLSRISLLASRSSSGSKSSRGVALVAMRSTGKLRFGGIFMIKVRRGLFPDNVINSSPQTLRRRQQLFCMTVAHTRRRYFLSCTGAHFQCNGVRFNDPDHFLGSVSVHFLHLPRSTKVFHEMRRRTITFHERGTENFTPSGRGTPCKKGRHISMQPGRRVVTPAIPHGLGQITPSTGATDASLSSNKSTGHVRRKRLVRRRHFNLNRILGIRNRKSGTGTAVHFGGTKSGRLLLHFTHFGIVK